MTHRISAERLRELSMKLLNYQAGLEYTLTGMGLFEDADYSSCAVLAQLEEVGIVCCNLCSSWVEDREIDCNGYCNTCQGQGLDSDDAN